MRTTLLIIVSTLAIGWHAAQAQPRNPNTILGFWTYSNPKFNNEYKKVPDFDQDQSGIEFLEDGFLRNWYETTWHVGVNPTHEYSDGTWLRTSDSTLTIEYHSPEQGYVQEDWQLLYLNSEKMGIKRLAYRKLGDEEHE